MIGTKSTKSWSSRSASRSFSIWIRFKILTWTSISRNRLCMLLIKWKTTSSTLIRTTLCWRKSKVWMKTMMFWWSKVKITKHRTMISVASRQLKRTSVQTRYNSKVMPKYFTPTNESYPLILKNNSKVFKGIDQSPSSSYQFSIESRLRLYNLKYLMVYLLQFVSIPSNYRYASKLSSNFGIVLKNSRVQFYFFINFLQ